MEKTTNNKDEHTSYSDYKMHQQIISGLQKGDIITMTVNGKQEFTCEVLHGVSAHVNISLQDRGVKDELTEEQKEEAIRQYRQANSI